MKKYYPIFYSDFKCLASDCPDTCCAGWEIPVDEKTEVYFLKSDTPFAEKVRNSITVNAANEKIFRQVGGRCPMLNSENLCDIRINCGWEYTCEVCHMYPDFIEEYDGYQEICPSFSCPAAVKLIMGKNAIYPRHNTRSNDIYLEFLLDLRNRVFDILDNEPDFFVAADECLSEIYAAEYAFSETYDFDDIDFQNEEYDGIFPEKQLEYYDGILSVFLRNEGLTTEWKKILIQCNSACENTVNDAMIEPDGSMINAFKYLVFRFFTKAVNGYSVSILTELLVNLVYTLKAFAVITNKPFEDICRLASKETEHNTGNIAAFAEFFL